MAGRTIGRHWPKTAKGDYVWKCDWCGVRWPMSQLTRKPGGLLACPDDVRGKDELELTEGNQARTPEPIVRGPGRNLA